MQKYSCPYFDILIDKSDCQAEMVMKFKDGIYNTAYVPSTCELIRREIPGVLKTKCFNQDNLPFSQEIKKTEMGHLFEHVLLQNLLEIKLSKGWSEVNFQGETSWDWRVEERGLFHILVDCEGSQCSEFNDALEKTISIMKKILASGIRYMERINPTDRKNCPSGVLQN